jgi:dihydroneopterin aldolase
VSADLPDPRDSIVLRGLRGYGRHGVLPGEREIGQPFVVDLALAVDVRAAGQSDDLADTADYASIATAVLAVVQGEPVALLERLAQKIADTVLQHEHVQAVDVTVHKPSAPVPVPFDDIAVTIRRTRP